MRTSIRHIDVHHHFFPDTLDKAKAGEKVGFRTPAENLPWTPAVSSRAMDTLDIDFTILSLPADLPGGEVGPQNRSAAREFNLMAASICKEHPQRFGFFACVPHPSDSQAAIAEIRFALDELGAFGVIIASSYGKGDDATYIGDDRYDLVWEELDRRKAVVFLHGAQTPSSTPFPHPFLGIPITEVPNETFKAASHLVVTGKKRRYHNVKIILAHLGGSTPSLAPRVAVGSRHMGCPLTEEQILEDFKSFYYETALSAHEATLSAMKAFVEPDHLLYGTDFPAVSTKMAGWFTNNVFNYYARDPAVLELVMGRNALNLFPQLASVQPQT